MGSKRDKPLKIEGFWEHLQQQKHGNWHSHKIKKGHVKKK